MKWQDHHDKTLDKNANQFIDLIENECTKMGRRFSKIVIDGGIKHYGGPPSCNGCNKPGCCYITTQAYFWEMFPLARHLRIIKRDSPGYRARLRAAGEEMESYERHAWMDRRVPCVFLKDGRCSVYRYRPSSCSSYWVWNGPSVCQPENKTVLVERTKADGEAVWLAFQTVNIVKDVMNVGPEIGTRAPVGSIPRMTALCLEILAAMAANAPTSTISDMLAREPFPESPEHHEAWLNGMGPYAIRRREREAGQDRPRSEDQHGDL